MKEKPLIDSDAVKRIMGMLNSSDLDNKYVGLKALNESNIDDSISFLIVLYKFSKSGSNDWKEHAPKVWSAMESIRLVDDETQQPTASVLLRKMIELSAPIEAITLYLELHSQQLIETLQAWGYPMEYMDVEIKLKQKEYEQSRLTSES